MGLKTGKFAELFIINDFTVGETMDSFEYGMTSLSTGKFFMMNEWSSSCRDARMG